MAQEENVNDANENGNGHANGSAMNLGTGSYGCDGSCPPSAWFVQPAAPLWRI